MKPESQSTEHPWVVIMRRKIRERGYEGDRLETQVRRMMMRFPFLRGQQDAHAGLYRAINISKGISNGH
jgi:hypothetical protein